AAHAWLAGQFDAAVHQFRELPANRQPEPGAAEGTRGAGVRLRERLEQCAALFLADADTAVTYAQGDAITPVAQRLDVFGAHRNAAGAGELDRVGHEVGKNLAYSQRVGDIGGRELRVGRGFQCQPLAGREAKVVADGVFDQPAQ